MVKKLTASLLSFIEMNMRKIIIILIALIFNENLFSQKVGTTSLQFLKVSPTARATAMGEAYVSVAKGVDAVFWNPSGITFSENHELSTTLTMWLFDTKQTAIAYSKQLGDWGAIGLQFQYVNFGEIEETKVEYLMFVGEGQNKYYNPGLTGRKFIPYSYLLGLTYAKQLTDKFATGLTAKYISENLYSQKTAVYITSSGQENECKTFINTILFDFGISYNTGFKSIRLGAAVQNFGPQIKFAKEAYPAPLIFRIGGNANLIGKEALFFQNISNRFTITYDMIQPNDYYQQMNFGFEYSFADVVFLRSGYKYNYDSDGITFGVGVKTELSNYFLSADYSFGDMGKYLNDVHRISIGVIIK